MSIVDVLSLTLKSSRPIKLFPYQGMSDFQVNLIDLQSWEPIEDRGISCSGLYVGGPTDEGFSRPIELSSAAPADTPNSALLCASLYFTDTPVLLSTTAE